MPNSTRGNLCPALNVLSGALLSLGILSAAMADDIEVFTQGASTGVKPNILFVLDYSGSMNDPVDKSDNSKGSKIAILRAAMASILDQNKSRINAGITLYSKWTSSVLWPVSDLTQYANTVDPQIPLDDDLRGIDVVSSIINNRNAGGSTATVGALMEAALYYSGGNVAAGGTLGSDGDAVVPQLWSTSTDAYAGDWYQPHPAVYKDNGSSVPASYNSPISNECQQNFVVLISDGVPTRLDEYAELTDYIGPVSSCESLSSSIFTKGGKNKELGNCGPEIAAKMHSSAFNPAFPDSTINTYTIGFNIGEAGEKYLSRIAADGNGDFFPAYQPEDLTDALDKIIVSILGEAQSFAELSVDINKATFSDDNRVYFPQFKPAAGSSWEGNLKGYFIDQQGLKDTNGLVATVTDSNGTRFVDGAQSFWSSVKDGNKVELGGASEKLASTNRDIYTYTGSGSPDGVNLAGPDTTHHFSIANSALDHNLLGITPGSTLRDNLINWLHDAPMGDALHSRSVPVRYTGKTVVFQATNQGLLHAFDATSPTDPAAGDHSGGQELFAFIPPELLPNLERIRNNDSTMGHIYGLDGDVTRWHNDANNDGIVNGTDTIMLIVGMRRGGNNYYALDVTDPANPRYMWNIKGGSAEFPDLAQSWSRMALIKVLKAGKPERVLVFGGGYDASVMDTATATSPASGNSVYMVDAAGNKIWSAQHGDMHYSIPSDIRVIDSNDDGYADRLYSGDLGGQIWRVDFDDVNVSASFKTSKLADLATSGFQPFFYPPSVALNSRASNEYLSVAIGSGNRANPMRTGTANKLYMIKDRDVKKGHPKSGSGTVNPGHLYNATGNLPGSANSDVASAAQEALQAKSGWYIDLAPGEKSLSKPLTFEGRLLATTFSPSASGSTDNCAVQATTSRYYAVDVTDGTPVDSLTNSDSDPDTVVTEDRNKVIATSGIPSSPILIFPPDAEKVQVVVDRTTVSYLAQRLNRIMWHPRNKQHSGM